MDPSDVLERILLDHRALRSMLDRYEMLARKGLQGRKGATAELRRQALELDAQLRQHMALEEQLLVPALRDADAWGPDRVDRFFEEHERQRDILDTILAMQDHAADDAFALAAWGLVRMLREDMDEEERLSVNAHVLADLPIHTQLEPD